MRQGETGVSDPLEVLRRRHSVKWRKFGDEGLPMFVAEMDYPLAEPVKRAMSRLIEADDLGYAFAPGRIGEAFAGFADRRWRWGVDPSRVWTTTDVSVAIVETLRQALRHREAWSGDGVVITPPVYPPFFELVPEAGGRVVEVPLAGELDIDGIERALAAGAKAVLISNPHNPTGLVHTAERLAELAEVAASYDATVVSDEIHAPLVHSGVTFTPFLSVSDAARRVGVAVTSASKAFNIAGTKCALMVAEDRAPLLDAMPHEVTFRTSILGLHANIAAFEEGDAWLDATVAEIEASAARLDQLLGSLPGVSWTPPSASYLAWLHFPPEWGDDPAARAMKAGVALASGPDFGNQGAGYARLTFACAPEVLAEAFERLARA